MKNKILLFFISVLLASGTMAQSARIGQHEAVTTWKAPAQNFASATEGKKIGQEIIDILGLKPNFEIQAANVPNAAAVVYGGKRFVLYNPQFIDRLTKATGTRWAAVSVLAHEIGHHLNGHTLGASGSQPKLELEADEFSGFVLRKMGASLQEAQVAMKLAANERGSKTHPGQQDRLVAIQKGWDQADDQLGGRNLARSAPRPQAQTPAVQTPRPQTQTVQTPAATASRGIIGEVKFNTDPNTRYFLTNQYNLVKLVNNQLNVIGKMTTTDNRQYPYMIYDNSTRLLVDTRGNIVSRNGQQVGLLRARA
jgi:hypothetical protein